MEYTVRFNFSTAKLGRGRGQIIGKSGSGECDITADKPFNDIESAKEDDAIKMFCVNALIDNKIKNVMSINVTEIIER